MKNSFWFLLNQSHNSKGEQSAFSQKIMLRYHHQICIDMFFCTLLIQNCSQGLFYLCMCTVYILVYRNRRSSTGGSKRLEAGDGNLRGCFYRLSYFSTPIIHLICVCKELSVNYRALNSIHTMHIRYTFFLENFNILKRFL